ncbi:MAG: hypothetical protein RJQ09_17350 [Cyclobacteriaceae bacterium]
MIWFRVKLEMYALALPYYQISLFKGTDYVKIYGGKWSVKLSPSHNGSLDMSFIRKLIQQKAKLREGSID